MSKFTVNVRYSLSATTTMEEKLYPFKSDIEVAIGDLVVVKDRNGFNLVRVVSIVEGCSPTATAWLIDKVDLSGMEARAKRTKLEAELKKAIDSTSVIERAKQLAGLNPDIARILSELG